MFITFLQIQITGIDEHLEVINLGKKNNKS